MKNLKMIKFVMVSAVVLLFTTACTNNTKTEIQTLNKQPKKINILLMLHSI